MTNINKTHTGKTKTGKTGTGLARFALIMAAVLMLSVVPSQGVAQAGGNKKIESLEFRETTVGEAIRLIARISGTNIFATREAANRAFSMTVNDTTVRGVVASIARVSGLSYSFDQNANAFMLMTNQQFAGDVVVTRNAQTKIFTLRHQNVVSAARVVGNLYGDRVDLNLETEDPDRLQLSSGNLQGSRSVGGSSSGSSGGGSSSGSGSGSTGNVEINLSEIDPRRLQEMVGVSPEGRDLSLADMTKKLGLEPPIYITLNREHNLLYVRTSDRDAMRDIERIIRETDRPTKQVLLEVRVMSLDMSDGTESAFDFGLSGDSKQTYNTLNGGSISGRRGAQSGTGATAGNGGMFFQYVSDNLLAQLNVMERENRAKTLSTPMLSASNNSPARLFVGSEAVLTRGFSSNTNQGTSGASNTTTTTNLELREVGQTLEILPRINADDTVTLVVEQENSTVVDGGATVPVVSGKTLRNVKVDTINTARIGGTVTARNGTTIALGGLIRNSSTNNSSRAPILGNIPLLGLMFRGDKVSKERSELVLLITPHIYSGGPEGERLARARLAQNSRNRDLENEILAANAGGVPSVKLRGQQQQYVALTRYAAAMRHGVQPVSSGPYRGIQSTPINSGGGLSIGAGGGLKLLGSNSVTAEAVESWNKRNLFVTAVVLTNTDDAAQAVGLANLKGRWIAATLETDNLAPRNEPGSRTYLYLISDRPYDDVIADLQAGGGL